MKWIKWVHHDVYILEFRPTSFLEGGKANNLTINMPWRQKPNGEATRPNSSEPKPHEGEQNEEIESTPPLYQAEHLSGQSDGKDQNAREDTKLRNAWQGIMGFEHTGKPHREVAVLMISWAEELDDLHTKGEVQQLEGVFKNLFHYEVVPREIKKGKRPCIQLAVHLAEFVLQFDSPTTLLIVYYAGHGFARKPGILQLAGYVVHRYKQPGTCQLLTLE